MDLPDSSLLGAEGAPADSMRSNAALIGVDWGTTQLRAYRIGSDGQLLERRHSPLGISSVREREFSVALDSVLSDWHGESNSRTDSIQIPILLCGMVGSRQGWRETPYTPCPASLDEVITNLVGIDTARGAAWIVGGVSTQDVRGRYDVMRGEETQIFGACESGERRVIVAPGTHSKWALVHRGTIDNFTTYITGELYAVLQKHSSLGWKSGPREADRTGVESREPTFEEKAFLGGVGEVRANSDLVHALFSVRTRTLFEDLRCGAQAAYLSGILIGNEVLHGLRRYPDLPITVIANDTLAPLYRMALAEFGRTDARFIDAEQAVIRGLWQLWQRRAFP